MQKKIKKNIKEPLVSDIFTAAKNYGTELSQENKNLIKKAFAFAKKAHEGQVRKSGEPYFSHVFNAGLNCARFGMSASTIAAGILHDTVEDTSATSEDIKEFFGEEICFLVEGVTKLGRLKYQGRKRHVESLRKFFIAIAKDIRVVIIKFADRIHNLETLEGVRPDKRTRIAIESIEIYAQLAMRLGMRKISSEIQDLAFPYAYPKEHAMVAKLLKLRKKSDAKYMEKVYRSVKKELAVKGVRATETHYRIKGTYSLYKKLLRKEMHMEDIYDVIALRICVPSMEDCYRVLGIIHAMWKPLPGRIKDYIALPKPNGYQSLHTTIFTGDGGIAEIQIRTPQMHDFSEVGLAAHSLYKGGGSFEFMKEFREYQNDPTTEDPDAFYRGLKSDFFGDRIFVFTPEGDVVDLPIKASVVDFAYAIHTEIGDHVSGAWVNGKYKAICTQLCNGDIVTIAKDPKSRPSRKWLSFVKTNHAKQSIRAYLKKNTPRYSLFSLGL